MTKRAGNSNASANSASRSQRDHVEHRYCRRCKDIKQKTAVHVATVEHPQFGKVRVIEWHCEACGEPWL